MNEISKCQNCRLWKTSQTGNGLYSCNKLMGEGIPSSIMFISTAPGDEEIKQKKPFVGLEGQLLKKYCSTVGIKAAYYTYLCKCKPGFGETISKKEIDACGIHLVEEIKKIQPKVIVLLGGSSLEFFGITSKITQARGIPVFSEKHNCHLVPTYNPAYLNNFTDQSRQRREFAEDLSKALQISIGGQAKPVEVNYKVAKTLEEVEQIAKELIASEWFAFDTETDGVDYLRSNILLTSFCTKEGTGYVIPYKHPKGFSEAEQPIVKQYLAQILCSPAKKIMQFGKFDLQMCQTAGFPVSKFAFDTCLAHYLLDENSTHGLDKIVPIYTDMGNYKEGTTDYFTGKIVVPNEEILNKYLLECPEFKEESYKEYLKKNKISITAAYRKANIFDCPYEQLTHYAAQDADATFRLFKKFWPLLEQEGLLNVLCKIMTPLSYVLSKMEYAGIGGDREYALKAAAELKAQTNEAIENILKSRQVAEYKKKYNVEGEFNPNSYKQKGELFFDIMGLVPLKYNKITPAQRAKGIKKGTASTDAEALELLLESNKIKVLEDFIKLGKIKKAQEYLEDYAELIQNSADNRIHTSFNQMGTETGRLSSSKPNLQNVPSHDPGKAKLIRTVFKAKPGYTFIEADYAQVEFRIWAHVSGDERMIAAINDTSFDIHTKVASQVFKIPEEKITKAQRSIAKQTVYGMMYGRSTYSIAKEYEMDEEEVNRFVNGFFRAFPVATQFIENEVAKMEKQGYITNMFGRRRRALDIYSKDKKLKERAQRQARNFPLQSGAADCVYIAMIKLYRELLPYDAKMLVQIHDSLIFEIKDEQLNAVIEVIRKTMETAVPLKCSMGVDIEVGKCLGDMKDHGI